MRFFWDFFKSEREKKTAKAFGNITHHLILSNEDYYDTLVISALPPPELHLIGPVN